VRQRRTARKKTDMISLDYIIKPTTIPRNFILCSQGIALQGFVVILFLWLDQGINKGIQLKTSLSLK
jgi:hypothetical protein